jgi:hypothetical protein
MTLTSGGATCSGAAFLFHCCASRCPITNVKGDTFSSGQKPSFAVELRLTQTVSSSAR